MLNIRGGFNNVSPPDIVPDDDKVILMTNTGTPDGTYAAKVIDVVNDVIITNTAVTFLNGEGSIVLNTMEIGDPVLVYIAGSNPPTTGLAYIGAIA